MESKKIFELLNKFFIFIFLCICLSGCGFNKNNDVVILKFSTWGSASEMKILKPIISEFETENPNIKIELIHIPQDYFKKIHLLLASNLAPDIIFINNMNLPVYEKFLTDLSQYIDKKDFVKQSIDAMSYKGKLYALPRDVSTLVVYYNKTLFDKKGLKYPNRNWTMDNMVLTAKRLTDKTAWGMSFEPQIYYALPYMHYYKGGILDSNGKEIYQDLKSQYGLSLYKNLAYKYHYAPTPAQTGSKTQAQLFIEGKIGMHLSGRWMTPKYREVVNFDWDVVNFPKYSASSDASGWAISKNSKNKELALKFILFLSRKKNIEKMASDGLIVPARTDVINSHNFLKGKPLSSEIFLYSVKKSNITNVSKKYNKIVDMLNDDIYQQ